MDADIQGALNQLNKSYRAFEHKGKSLTKNQVKTILEYGLKKGYKYTNEFSDEEVDNIINNEKLKEETIKKWEESGLFINGLEFNEDIKNIANDNYLLPIMKSIFAKTIKDE